MDILSEEGKNKIQEEKDKIEGLYKNIIKEANDM